MTTRVTKTTTMITSTAADSRERASASNEYERVTARHGLGLLAVLHALSLARR